MAAITTDRASVNLALPQYITRNVPVAAGEKIYSGTFVIVNSAGDAISGVASTAGKYAGVALEQVDNTSGSAGDVSIDVAVGGVWNFDSDASITKADEGTAVYVSDNHTFTQTVGTNTLVGKIFQVEGTTTAFVTALGLLT